MSGGESRIFKQYPCNLRNVFLEFILNKWELKMYKLLFTIAIFCFSLTAPLLTFGFDVTGDEVNLSGTITSVVLTDEGGLLSVVSR